MAKPALIDEVVPITRPVLLGREAWQQIVVTRWGVVVVDARAGWTGYRFVVGESWWSVWKGGVKTQRQIVREAARLLRVARLRERVRAQRAREGWR